MEKIVDFGEMRYKCIFSYCVSLWIYNKGLILSNICEYNWINVVRLYIYKLGYCY